MTAALGEAPDPVLDPELRAAIAARAAAWAEAVATAGRAWVTDAAPAALSDLLSEHDGPVLLVAPDVPRLDAALADAALGDLAAGCLLSFAPATDATPFLLALAEPRWEALALLALGDRTRDAFFAEILALGGRSACCAASGGSSPRPMRARWRSTPWSRSRCAHSPPGTGEPLRSARCHSQRSLAMRSSKRLTS